jgi:hypothetical protein
MVAPPVRLAVGAFFTIIKGSHLRAFFVFGHVQTPNSSLKTHPSKLIPQNSSLKTHPSKLLTFRFRSVAHERAAWRASEPVRAYGLVL